MIKNFIQKTVALRLINTIPFPLIKLTRPGKVIALYYHLVNDQDASHVKHLYKYKTTREFIADIEFILKHYSPIDLSELIRGTESRSVSFSNRFLLTFDDGFKEIYDVIAPILKAKGIPATFFICSAFIDNRELCYQHKASLLVENILKGVSPMVEGEIKRILMEDGCAFSKICDGILQVNYSRRDSLDKIANVLMVDFNEYLAENQPYLTTNQVKELIDSGFSIGSHSIDHPYYSALSLDEQLIQTITSVQCIRESFGLNYGAFAFPHHDTGVTHEFFIKLKDSGLVDITFGTGGMRDTGIQSHMQRINLENPLRPAQENIAWQYARAQF